MLAPLLALALAALPPVTPLDTPQPARARVPGVGRVVQVTGTRAYLDAGEDDGLATGQVLALWRGEVEAGRCTVEAVGPGSATCTGGGARAGDAFKLAPRPQPEVKVVTLPTPPADEELARRAAAVAAGSVPLVTWKAAAPAAPALAAPRANVAEVALGDAFWSASGGDTWDVVRLDANVHGAPLGPVTVDLDLRDEQWLSRGQQPTFRPADDTRLYVWQAQVGYATPDGALALAAGRILPWTVPGATVMDGGLAAWKRAGWELGAFGGLVPAPDTLDPTTTRATAGGYWSLDRRWGKDVVLRQEGRLAWVRSPELGDRAELEADAMLHSGAALDLFAQARVGAGGTVQADGLLDAARLELGWRPLARLAVSGGVEYGGLAVPWSVEPAIFASKNRRADASAFYDLGAVRVGLTGGLSRDAVSGLERSWVGPEVQVPRFLSPRVALSAGYLEEFGWLAGRSAWLQTVARPWDRLRLIGRLSWMHESTLSMDQEELGLSLIAAAELTQRIGLRFSALGRAGLSASMGEGGSVPSSVNATVSVYALF
jgi:hypothetical protein